MLQARTRLVLIWLLVFGSAIAFATTLTPPFKNFAQLAQGLGFGKYANSRSARTIKVAILDNGFRDYAAEIGKSLPITTTYHKGPIDVDPKTEESHGLFMAQMLAGLLDRTPGINYELHLYSAFGYSNLEAAANSVVDGKFDVVLYSQVWEYGGNGDGKGFINTLVNKAIATGVIWVNASGNFGNGTYQASVDVNDDSWAKLPGPNQSVRVRCQKNSNGDKCPLRVVLSWNDFKDDVNIGTDKDLDLVVTDDSLKIISSSAFQQVKQMPDPAPPGQSLYPREIVQTEVDPGLYLVRVKARSTNFDKSKDRLRLTISGDRVDLIDQTDSETLLPPADNPSVITIGANDSEKSSNSASMMKPELVTPSLITLTNGDQYKGSSNSAAIAAAAVVVLKGITPSLSRENLIRMLGGTPSYFQGDRGHGLPLTVLDFAATGSDDCFVPTRLPYVPAPLMGLLQARQVGATFVQTTKGPKIFVPVDPFLMTNVARVSFDDMLVVSNSGFEPLPRSNQEFMPPGFYEVVQQPEDARICPLAGTSTTNSTARAPGASLHL